MIDIVSIYLILYVVNLFDMKITKNKILQLCKTFKFEGSYENSSWAFFFVKLQYFFIITITAFC